MSSQPCLLFIGDSEDHIDNLRPSLPTNYIIKTELYNSTSLANKNVTLFPDLILIDITTSKHAALDSCNLIKSDPDLAKIPLILLVNEQQKEGMRPYIELGIENYIFKPMVISTALEKIASLIASTEQPHTPRQRLLYLEKQENQDFCRVERIFNQYSQRNQINCRNLRSYMSPMSVFNGDFFVATPSPFGGLYIAVGDITGHGLPAAIAGLPASAAIRSMAKKGIGVGSIAAELNRQLPELQPREMMLAATLIELNSDCNQLKIWSGGMLPVIITNQIGQVRKIVESHHAPLAMLAPEEFLGNIDIIDLLPGDRIYLYTDGITESTNSKDEMFGEHGIISSLKNASDQPFEHLLHSFRQFVGDKSQADDITLVEIHCQPFLDFEKNDEVINDDSYQIPLSMQFDIGPDDLRQADPIPQIMSLFRGVRQFEPHLDNISTVLSELFNNALEHGLLQLSSDIKNGDNGFFDYYNEKEDRLRSLDSGSISINFNYFHQGKDKFLSLKIRDSGDGFKVCNRTLIADKLSHGRGIFLVREICQHLSYHQGGRCAQAVYQL